MSRISRCANTGLKLVVARPLCANAFFHFFKHHTNFTNCKVEVPLSYVPPNEKHKIEFVKKTIGADQYVRIHMPTDSRRDWPMNVCLIADSPRSLAHDVYLATVIHDELVDVEVIEDVSGSRINWPELIEKGAG